MASFRQRISVQKRKKQERKQQDIVEIQDRIHVLQHNLYMYRQCMFSFQEDTEEWEICRDAVYDIIPELSMLEQEEANMKDGRD